MNIDERLSLLEELLSCNGNIYCWTYDSDGHLLHTNCTELLYDVIFEVSGCKNYMLTYGRENTLPLVLGAELGLIWCAAFEKKDNETKFHVIGPLLNSDVSFSRIRDSMHNKGLSEDFMPNFETLIHQLPIVTAPFSTMYTIMLHCCITGEKIPQGKIQFQVPDKNSISGTDAHAYHTNRQHTYEAEREMLAMVREGNLNYQPAFEKSKNLSSGVRVRTGRPIEQGAISGIVFTSLCVRAAIEGGLSQENAYTLGDDYIQRMTQCKTIPELSATIAEMYDSFVQRVHRLRTNLENSKAVLVCCDFGISGRSCGI
jgi:protein-tyrosine phosphatase